MDDDTLLHCRVTVPEHVVRRHFAEETIALNLETGRYHGLNKTAAAMLDALEDGAEPALLVLEIAAGSGEPVSRIEADVLTLLRVLAERDLVEVHDRGAA